VAKKVNHQPYIQSEKRGVVLALAELQTRLRHIFLKSRERERILCIHTPCKPEFAMRRKNLPVVMVKLYQPEGKKRQQGKPDLVSASIESQTKIHGYTVVVNLERREGYLKI